MSPSLLEPLQPLTQYCSLNLRVEILQGYCNMSKLQCIEDLELVSSYTVQQSQVFILILLCEKGWRVRSFLLGNLSG